MSPAATALDVAKRAIQAKPYVRYAVHVNGTAVAAWDGAEGRWVAVAGLLLDGRWASMPHEVHVDGKPWHAQSDWSGVTPS